MLLETHVQWARISAGESLSEAVSLMGYLLGVHVPEGTEGQQLSVVVGAMRYDCEAQLKDRWKRDVTIRFEPGTAIAVADQGIRGWPYIRLRTVDNGGSPVTQSEERTICLTVR